MLQDRVRLWLLSQGINEAGVASTAICVALPPHTMQGRKSISGHNVVFMYFLYQSLFHFSQTFQIAWTVAVWLSGLHGAQVNDWVV